MSASAERMASSRLGASRKVDAGHSSRCANRAVIAACFVQGIALFFRQVRLDQDQSKLVRHGGFSLSSLWDLAVRAAIDSPANESRMILCVPGRGEKLGWPAISHPVRMSLAIMPFPRRQSITSRTILVCATNRRTEKALRDSLAARDLANQHS